MKSHTTCDLICLHVVFLKLSFQRGEQTDMPLEDLWGGFNVLPMPVLYTGKQSCFSVMLLQVYRRMRGLNTLQKVGSFLAALALLGVAVLITVGKVYG